MKFNENYLIRRRERAWNHYTMLQMHIERHSTLSDSKRWQIVNRCNLKLRAALSFTDAHVTHVLLDHYFKFTKEHMNENTKN